MILNFYEFKVGTKNILAQMPKNFKTMVGTG